MRKLKRGSGFLSDFGGLLKYVFTDGGDYIQVPEWSPNGLPYSFSVKCRVDNIRPGEVHRILASDTGLTAHIRTDGQLAIAVYDVDQNFELFNFGLAVVGEVYEISGVFDTDLATVTVNGVEQTRAFTADSKNQPPITAIGAVESPAANAFFEGPIWDVELSDNSVFQFNREGI